MLTALLDKFFERFFTAIGERIEEGNYIVFEAMDEPIQSEQAL